MNSDNNFLDDEIILGNLYENETCSETYRWMYSSNKQDGWWMYNKIINKIIEQMHKDYTSKTPNKLMQITVNGCLYTIDFENEQQHLTRNVSKARNLKRINFKTDNELQKKILELNIKGVSGNYFHHNNVKIIDL